MFKTGEKVYCKSMKKNLVVACKEGDYACTCIDIFYGIPESKRFGTFVLSNHDLISGWMTKDELDKLRESV